MAMTKSGWLTLNKTEQKGLRTLLHHAQSDMDYGAGGSYGDAENVDKKELKSGQVGADVLEFIIDTFCDKN